MAGELPRRWGSAHGAIVPYQAFAAADGYLVIGATNDAHWQQFCRAVGLEHLADDPRFATNAERVRHRAEVRAAIEPVLRTRPRADWVAILRTAGVPCGPVNAVDEAFADPQVEHCGLVREVAHPTLGAVRLVGIPAGFPATPATIRRHPPLLGEHTAEVLHELLGYGPDEIERLVKNRTVRLHKPRAP